MRTSIATVKSILTDYHCSFYGTESSLDFSSIDIYTRNTGNMEKTGLQNSVSLLPVYIARVSEGLDHLPQASLWIIINDTAGSTVKDLEPPYFIIDEPVSADEIYQHILHGLFNEHLLESMYHDVLEEMARNTDMNTVLRIFSRYLNAPFTIMSPARRVLASSFPKDSATLSMYPITKNMLATLEQGYLVEESVDFIKEHAGLDILRLQAPNKVIRIKASDDLDVLAVDLVVRNQFIGALVMYGFYRRLTEADIEIMNHLRSFVLIMINYNAKISRQYSAAESYFVFDLITQKLSREQAVQQAKERGITTKGWLKAFLIARNERSASRNVPLLMFSANLEMILGSRFSVIIDEHIFIISELGDSPVLDDQKHERLQNYLQENNLICAVSNPFKEIAESRHIWKQVGFLLNECSPVSESSPFIFFQDHFTRWMLNEFKSMYPAQSIYSGSLLLLQQYDEKNETEYYRTLQTYIACDCNLQKCAEELDIHYNTAKYRMNMIKRIGHLELDTPEKEANIAAYLELNRSTVPGKDE